MRSKKGVQWFGGGSNGMANLPALPIPDQDEFPDLIGLTDQ